ncbi:hypothetical protein PR048_025884 [Dryococelus australis]|uniref:TIR domain-containing protein n=1 Tax=Dryococelus australis TaxID=614101 RepID=A0ABQ9GJT3_9NEOP|nr:hypothetical protein PR048_025884 [Dryococelus australis]
MFRHGDWLCAASEIGLPYVWNNHIARGDWAEVVAVARLTRTHATFLLVLASPSNSCRAAQQVYSGSRAKNSAPVFTNVYLTCRPPVAQSIGAPPIWGAGGSGFESRGAAVVQWLDYSPPTKAIRVRFPAGLLHDFRMRDSCRTMSLVDGFSRGSPVPSFRRCFTLALNTSMLRAAQISHPAVPGVRSGACVGVVASQLRAARQLQLYYLISRRALRHSSPRSTGH